MLSTYKGVTQMTGNTAPTGQWCPQMSTCRSLEPVLRELTGQRDYPWAVINWAPRDGEMTVAHRRGPNVWLPYPRKGEKGK